MLGQCLLQPERHQEAEPLLKETYSFFVRTAGSRAPPAEASRAALKALYAAMGKPDQARALEPLPPRTPRSLTAEALELERRRR